MIDTIFIDMDGVLCNFEGRYIDLFKEIPGRSRDKKEFSKNWTDFVIGQNFTTLEFWPGAQELLAFISTVPDIKVKILTSSGGLKYHELVKDQKIQWLNKRGIDIEPIVVTNRSKKGEYATATSVLIDDTADVIDTFNEKGGIGILHKNSANTIKLLEILLNT